MREEYPKRCLLTMVGHEHFEFRYICFVPENAKIESALLWHECNDDIRLSAGFALLHRRLLPEAPLGLKCNIRLVNSKILKFQGSKIRDRVQPFTV
jgi:hypothetical protein